MKIAGIIAEYNPFHTGHAHHIAQTRALSGADGIAVMMSGNFVQRGGPSIADKWTRARAAVAGGADVVFELPVYYAHAPAQVFAYGGVQSFIKSGCIDVLSFGAETPGFLAMAKTVAAREWFIDGRLQNTLTPGEAYPIAYAKAVEAECGIAADILSKPNNILALEYVKALAHARSRIEPLCIERIGAGYHETQAKDGFASATALRKKIVEGDVSWEQYMPEAVLNIYKEANAQHKFPVTEKQFDTAVLSVLRRVPARLLRGIADMPPAGFENRIAQMAVGAESIEQLTALCGAKHYTTARVRRVVWNCFLGLPELGYAVEPTYLRVLAFNEKGRGILKKMKQTSTIPLVTKAADFEADELFTLDVRATDLYFASAQTMENRCGGADYKISPFAL